MGFHAEVKVRFADVDNAGIVYYPRLFHYFHIAFEELFAEAFGIPYVDVIGKERVGFPAVHAEADFEAPLRFGDVADVEVGVEKVGGKSVTFTYRLVRKPAGQLCATGRVVVATIDLSTFRAVPVPDRYRKLFEALAAGR